MRIINMLSSIKHVNVQDRTVFTFLATIVSSLLMFGLPYCLPVHCQLGHINFLLPPFYSTLSSNYVWALLSYAKHLKKMTFLPQKFSSSGDNPSFPKSDSLVEGRNYKSIGIVVACDNRFDRSIGTLFVGGAFSVCTVCMTQSRCPLLFHS